MIELKESYKIDKRQFENVDENQLIDSVLESIDRQKNEKPQDQITGLLVRAIDSHAFKLTRHRHLYLPAHVEDAVSKMTSPYNIPVLTHHDTMSDPIGRIVEAKYVATPNSAIADEIISLNINTKNLHKKIRKYNDILFDSNNLGLGYIESVSNIVDEDAIKKIVSGIYNTISVGYRTDKVICSECGEPLWSCEHIPGKDYGHGPVYAIFGNLEYTEKSYVNVPADPHAQTVDFKYLKQQDNAKGDNFDVDSLCEGSCFVSFSFNDKTSNNKQEVKMTYNEFIKLGDELYQKVIDKLPDDNKVSIDDIKSLEEKSFVGANKLIPADSEEMIKASIEVINEELEDSDEKNELLELLNGRLNNDQNNDSDDNKDNKDGSDDDQDSDSDNDSNSDDSVVEVIEELIKLKKSEFTVSEASDAFVQFAGVVLSDKDKAVELLKKTIDSMENADEVLNAIFEDKVNTFNSRIDNLKHELAIQKDNFKDLMKEMDALTEELKDMYIEKLLAFKGKEDPEKDNDSLKEEFKSRSLDALKTTYSDMLLLIGNKEDNVDGDNIDSDVNNLDGGSSDDILTEEELKQRKDNIYKNYRAISKVDSQKAQVYLKDALARLEELKKEQSKQN